MFLPVSDMQNLRHRPILIFHIIGEVLMAEDSYVLRLICLKMM